MKRVLHIVGSLERGGIQIVALNCMRYSEKGEYQFDYLVYGDKKGDFEDEIIRNGGNIIRVPYKKYNYIFQYKQLYDAMKEYGPYDIVHAHTFFNSGLAMKAAYYSKVKVRIAHAHSTERVNDKRIGKKIFNKTMRVLLNKYSTVICACSKSAGEYVFGNNEFANNGIVLNNVIKIDDFKYSEQNRMLVRQEFGIDENSIVIGNVGRIVAPKNPHRLIDVFEQFHAKHKDSVLLLVGDGVLQKEVEQHVSDHGLSNCVVFTGMRKDVPNILSAMDIFITTSIYEGFGIVLIEAMANGMLCLGPEGVIVEEVSALERCILVKDNQWSEILEEIYSGKRLAFSDCKRMLSEYDSENFKDKINQIYSAD